jgi:UrcA family protein
MLPRVRMIALSATLLVSGFNLAHADEISRETIVAPESPQLERRTELVRIGDLNLRSEGGQAVLMQRLNHAAKDVCDPFVDNRALREMHGFHVCYDTAMADATFKVRTFLASVPQANESIASIAVTGPVGQ